MAIIGHLVSFWGRLMRSWLQKRKATSRKMRQSRKRLQLGIQSDQDQPTKAKKEPSKDTEAKANERSSE